ncbi:MAG: hypothetical protein DI547_07460 [Sphingobium sp.]|nr:MAG: hypothetical protein DI547_07460 [Sphingobium sp.]
MTTMIGIDAMATTGHPMPAALFSARGKLPITIMDLTEAGATAKGKRPPPCDSYALLVRNGVKVPAMVRWIDESRFGLEFEEPLADARRCATFRGQPSAAAPVMEPAAY